MVPPSHWLVTRKLTELFFGARSHKATDVFSKRLPNYIHVLRSYLLWLTLYFVMTEKIKKVMFSVLFIRL